ncbi:hypothetical protein ABTZ57_15940 [Streptomyces sp. NPDC094048]|uniref:hypothetical protein n=1 Tax=Streptomyces sp. NPDC094048 TaxID=3155207 RepID=UPI003325475F
MSRTTYLTAGAALTLVVGLSVLITSAAVLQVVGPALVTGIAITLVGAITTAITGVRAAREYAAHQLAHADSAALAQAIIAHDTQLSAPPERSVVMFEARRTTRENTT